MPETVRQLISLHTPPWTVQIKYKQKSAKELSQYHLSMDMLEVAHAKKAQALASDQDYRLTLHNYTSLADNIQTQAAKRAYALQSDVRDRPLYRGHVTWLDAWMDHGWTDRQTGG